MTHEQHRRYWLWAGQMIAGGTVAVLIAGFVVTTAAQGMTDQTALNLQQAATNAVLSSEVKALADRMSKIEALINWALLGIVGTAAAQWAQFRAGRKA